MKLRHYALVAALTLGASNAFSQYNQEFEVTDIRSFGGTGLELTADMTIDSQGNQYLLGRYRDGFDDGNGVTDDANGKDRLFLQKSDFNGNILWTKLIIDAQSSDVVSPGKVAFDSDDNAYIFFSGYRNQVTIDPNGENIAPTSTVTGAEQGPDMFLWKLKPNGTSAWVKTFGGNNHDWARTIAIDDNDDIIIGGTFLNTANFQPDLGPDLPLIQDVSFVLTTPTIGANDYDGFVAKLDSSGQAIWVSQFDGSDFEQVDDLAVDPLGNISVVGWTESSNFTFPNISSPYNSAMRDGFVGRLSSLGIGFAVEYFSGIGDDDRCSNVEVDASNNTYLSLTFASSTINFGAQSINNTVAGNTDALVVKYSPSLIYDWHYGVTSAGNDNINDLTIAPDGSIYVAGHVQHITQHGGVDYGYSTAATSNDAFVLNLESNGTFNHFSITGGAGVEITEDVEFHSDGTMFIYGQAETLVPFIVGSDTLLLNNAGSRDIFLVRGYDCVNLPAPQVSFSGDSIVSNTNLGASFEWLYDDGTTVTTYAGSTNNFITNPTDSGSYALVVSFAICDSDTSNFVVFDPNGGGSSSLVESELVPFICYPNPTNGMVHIKSEGIEEFDRLIVLDLNGRVVFESGWSESIDLSTLQNGMYVLRISTKTNVYSTTLMKQ